MPEGGLRDRDVTATVVSAMVGAGIFIAPGVLLQQGAPQNVVLLLFAVAGIVVTAGAFTLADLAKRLPGNGGPHRYLRHHLGPWAGFLYGWSRFWVMQCGALAVLSLTCARFLADAVGTHHPYWEAVAALVLLAGTAGIHTRGLQTSAWVQAGLTGLKIAIVLAIAAGVLFAARATSDPIAPSGEGSIGGWMLIAIFAFGGWTQVTFLAGEARHLRRPIALGIAIVTALYLVMLVAMFRSGDLQGDVIAAEAAGNLYGPTVRRAVSLAIALAVYGTLHTQSLTGPRLYQAAAEAGDWWRPFAERNARGAPGKAIWFQAEWAALLVAISLLAANAFAALIGAISTAIWTFHLLLAIAWFRDPGKDIHWVWPALFLVAAAGVMGAAVWSDIGSLRAGVWSDVHSAWALGIIASGLVVHVARSKGSQRAAISGVT